MFIVVVGPAFGVAQLVIHGWRIGTKFWLFVVSYRGAAPNSGILCMTNQFLATLEMTWDYFFVLKTLLSLAECAQCPWNTTQHFKIGFLAPIVDAHPHRPPKPCVLPHLSD